MRTSFALGLAAAALLSITGAATAAEFYAAPMNSGPPSNLPGTQFPPAGAALQVFNGVTQPILQPMLAPAPMAAAEPAPMMHRHRHHHHHMMMKHKM